MVGWACSKLFKCCKKDEELAHWVEGYAFGAGIALQEGKTKMLAAPKEAFPHPLVSAWQQRSLEPLLPPHGLPPLPLPACTVPHRRMHPRRERQDGRLCRMQQVQGVTQAQVQGDAQEVRTSRRCHCRRREEAQGMMHSHLPLPACVSTCRCDFGTSALPHAKGASKKRGGAHHSFEERVRAGPWRGRQQVARDARLPPPPCAVRRADEEAQGKAARCHGQGKQDALQVCGLLQPGQGQRLVLLPRRRVRRLRVCGGDR